MIIFGDKSKSMTIKKITHAELEELLQIGSLYFYHRKVNGDLKKAFGTTCDSRLPAKALPVPVHIGCSIYYDIIVGQYRSCSKKLDVWIETYG